MGYICLVNLPDNILKMIKTSQKISEQMVAVNKIAETIKLSENLSKALNASASIGLTNKQCLSYLSNPNIEWATSEDLKSYDWIKPIQYEAYFKAQSQSIFYCGGDFEPLELKPFWHELTVTDNFYSHSNSDGFVSLKPSLDLIKVEDSISQLATLSTLKSVSAQSIKDSLKSRNEITDRVLNIFYSIEEKYGIKAVDYDYEKELNKFLNSHDGLHDLLVASYARILEYDARISFEITKIQILNRIYKSIKIGLKKISLNKREIFRKMNSFLFKNLDDYHSLAY